MSKLTLLTKHIAGREFCIHNLHSIIVDGKIVGYKFQVRLPYGDKFDFDTGVMEKDEMQHFSGWLMRNG